jgi:hypothetical protein
MLFFDEIWQGKVADRNCIHYQRSSPKSSSSTSLSGDPSSNKDICLPIASSILVNKIRFREAIKLSKSPAEVFWGRYDESLELHPYLRHLIERLGEFKVSCTFMLNQYTNSLIGSALSRS